MIETKEITPELEEAFNLTKKSYGELSQKNLNRDYEIQETLMKLDDMKISVSNELVLGAQPFQSTLEAKLLRIVLSQVYSEDTLDSSSYIAYTAKVGEIAKKLFPGKKTFRKSIYNDIKKTAIALQSRILYVKDAKTGRFSARNWTIGTDGSGYEKGTLSIILNPLLYPYLTQLDRNFSIFSLDTLLNFKSKYTMRIYEGLYAKIHRDKKSSQGFNNGNTIEISFQIDEFRIVSSTVGMYSNIKDLKKKCIVPSVKEITEKTDMNITGVDYRAKSGRATDTIVFLICQNEDFIDGNDIKTREIIEKQYIFDATAELTLDYMEAVFQEFGLLKKYKKVLPALLQVYLDYGEFTSAFNNDFTLAYQGAKKDVVKYMEKMIENRHNKKSEDPVFVIDPQPDDVEEVREEYIFDKEELLMDEDVELAEFEEVVQESQEKYQVRQDDHRPDLLGLLKDDAEVDTIYITKIFNALSCYYDMDELVKVMQLYNKETKLFNDNIKKAVDNEAKDIVKYLIAAGENNKASGTLSRRGRDLWMNEAFEKDFQEILDYWDGTAAAMQAEQALADGEIYALKRIKRTDIRHKRYMHALLEDGETLDSIKEAIETAAESAYFLRTQGSFNFFINPKNYYDIAAGERDYDSEAAAMWKMEHRW